MALPQTSMTGMDDSKGLPVELGVVDGFLEVDVALKR